MDKKTYGHKNIKNNTRKLKKAIVEKIKHSLDEVGIGMIANEIMEATYAAWQEEANIEIANWAYYCEQDGEIYLDIGVDCCDNWERQISLKELLNNYIKKIKGRNLKWGKGQVRRELEAVINSLYECTELVEKERDRMKKVSG